MINRSALKAEAKLDIRSRKPGVYLVALAYYVIIYVIDFLSLKVNFPGLNLAELMESGMNSELLREKVMSIVFSGSQSFTGELLSAALSIMTVMIGVGFTAYCLKLSRGDPDAGFGDLFEAFGIFFKMLILQFLTGIFVFLWSLLLVIPGIIAAYRYSMAVYLLLDHPDMTPMECIRMSKEITQGYKGSLFVLDLSFIGWNLLTGIPLIGIVIALFVSVYYGITHAKYYNVLSNYQPQVIDVNGDPSGSYDDREPWER